jgi:arylsulfatase A-like enzyme
MKDRPLLMTLIRISKKRKRIGLLLLAITIVLIGYGIFSDNKKYNLIFVSIDALRADHLGCYGYWRNTSPNIDAFAENHILFQNFFTVVPKTGPSMTSFFTGKIMQNHGVLSNDLRRDPSIKMLAQLLPKSFRKAAFGANPLLAAGRGYSDGFENFDMNLRQAELTPTAIKWIEKNSNQKFFLWLHYIDPHGPYKPPAEYHEMFVTDQYYDGSKKVALDYIPQKGLNKNFVLGAVPIYQRLGNIDEVDYYVAEYDAEIRYTDNEIGKLINYLKSTNLIEKTIIFITADHGESLGENNYYFEHGMLVNEGSIHIPLIISHPDIKKPLIINSLLQNTDICPTILREFNIKYPGEIDGIDFSNLFERKKSNYNVREYIYSCTPIGIYNDFYETIRTKKDKLIIEDEKDVLYYDISKDKIESINIFNDISKDIIEDKICILNKFGRKSIKSAAGVKLTNEARDRLKSLGYVD